MRRGAATADRAQILVVGDRMSLPRGQALTVRLAGAVGRRAFAVAALLSVFAHRGRSPGARTRTRRRAGKHRIPMMRPWAGVAEGASGKFQRQEENGRTPVACAQTLAERRQKFTACTQAPAYLEPSTQVPVALPLLHKGAATISQTAQLAHNSSLPAHLFQRLERTTMPRTMKAAVMYEPGAPEVLKVETHRCLRQRTARC